MRRRTVGGRYQTQAEIGSGGMGTVYRARDKRTGLVVAVKLLHAHLAQDEAYLERFRREAHIATSLESSHVVKVLDYGEDQGAPFIAMEFVAGKSLRAILRERGRLSENEALAIAVQVVDALAEAHRKGVVHRDIKPQNIMITPDGTVKVADFGIARADDYSTITQTGAFFGTVQYAAPEHFQGKADTRSDIYSLGVVLYQMLSGSPPFAGDTLLEVMRLHVEEPPPPLTSRAPDVRGEIDAIVGRCLAKSPAERFQSPDELSAAIRSVLPPEAVDRAGGVPPPRRRLPWMGAMVGWWRGRSIGFKLTGAGVVALLVCGVGLGGAAGLGIWNPGEPSSTPAVVATPTPVPPWELAYVDPSGNLRVSTADRSESRQLTFDGAAAHPAWSPDGKTIAFVRVVVANEENPTATQLFTIDVETGEQRRIHSVEEETPAEPVASSDRLIRNPRWSKDGVALLYQVGSDASGGITWRLLWELDQDADAARILFPAAVQQGALWSPDAVGNPPGPEYSFDVSSVDGGVVYQTCDDSVPPNCGMQLQKAEPLESLEGLSGYHGLATESDRELVGAGGGSYFWAPTFSPDGTKIAYYSEATGETAVFVMTLADGAVSEVANATVGDHSLSSLWPTLAWSADGSKILYESDGAIWAVEVGRQSAQPSILVEGKHPAWLHRRAAPAEPTAVTASAEARSVPIDALLRPGTTAQQVLYGEMTGDSVEEIVLLSSAARVGHEQQYLDVFSYDAAARLWTRILNGTEWPAPEKAMLFTRPDAPFWSDAGQFIDTLELLDIDGDESRELAAGVTFSYGNWGGSSVWVIGLDGQEGSVLYHDIPDTGSMQGPSWVKVRPDGRLVVTGPYWQPDDAHASPSQEFHQLVGYDEERGRVAVLRQEKTVYSYVPQATYDLFSLILGSAPPELPDVIANLVEGSVTLEHLRLGTTTVTAEELRQALEQRQSPYLTCRAATSLWEADLEGQGTGTRSKALLVLHNLGPFYYDFLAGQMTTEERRRDSAEDILAWTVLEFIETDGQWYLSSLIVGDREVLGERYEVSGNSEGCPVAGIDYDASVPTSTSTPTGTSIESSVAPAVPPITPVLVPPVMWSPSPAATETPPPLSGRIAFVSWRDGDAEIYVMNIDGSNQTRLTDNPAWDGNPAWSPDGSNIAFVSDRDGNQEVYVMNIDGSNQTRLTNNVESDYGPVWSPDGSKIAFESYRDGNQEIYVMNADGSDQRRLTDNPAADGADWPLVWSPDGSKIAFVSDRDGNDEIYAMNTDGSNQTRLTNSLDPEWYPAWSPDGSKIAFSVARDEIYVMTADGSQLTNLTNKTGNDWRPVWSPDGSRIAFESYRDGDQKIYVMNADGSEQIRLANLPGPEWGPMWSPAGFKIAFMFGDEIYLVNADGSQLTNLTNNPETDTSPAWAP